MELTADEEIWAFVERIENVKTPSETITILKDFKRLLETWRDMGSNLEPHVAKAIQNEDMSTSYISSLNNAKTFSATANYIEALISMLMGADQNESHYFEIAFTNLRGSEDISPLAKYPMTLLCESGMASDIQEKKKKFVSAFRAAKSMKDSTSPIDHISLYVFLRAGAQIFKHCGKDSELNEVIKRFRDFIKS